jgi:hypothetical protein
MTIETWCPECGYGVKIDEEGCCISCGVTAIGKGVDQALAAEARTERERQRGKDLLALGQNEKRHLRAIIDDREFRLDKIRQALHRALERIEQAEQRAQAWARLASFAKHASDCAALDGDDCTCGLAEAKRAALSPQAPQEVSHE